MRLTGTWRGKTYIRKDSTSSDVFRECPSWIIMGHQQEASDSSSTITVQQKTARFTASHYHDFFKVCHFLVCTYMAVRGTAGLGYLIRVFRVRVRVPKAWCSTLVVGRSGGEKPMQSRARGSKRKCVVTWAHDCFCLTDTTQNTTQ